MASLSSKPCLPKAIDLALLLFIYGIGYYIGLNTDVSLCTAPLSSVLRGDSGHSPAACDPISTGASGREYGNGWHSIEVFYGRSDHLEATLPKDVEWFSQVRQDEIVTRLLKGKRNGFFVDLAANDATILSNTYSLEKKFGWTGLCIEPNPIYWSNHAYRDCQVVAAVVGKERMEEVRFRFNNGVFGGIAADGFDNGDQDKAVSDRKYTVTLKEILERFNAPKLIDYLSLDVEGAESYIMNQFPFSDYNASLMTVERPKEDLKAFLGRSGYTFIRTLSDWGETLWAHESIMDSLDLASLDDFDPTPSPTPDPTPSPSPDPTPSPTPDPTLLTANASVAL